MSLRVIAVGRTQTGKTEWLWRRYLRRLPRVLIVDTIGEWSVRMDRGEVIGLRTSGSDDTLAALEGWGREAPPTEQVIVADLDRDELGEVVDVILPRQIGASPVPSWGGSLAVAIDEVDIMVPPGDRRLGGLWRRGRHVGISVYSATQRPASVNKEVSAMVDIYGVLAVTEVRDVEYLRQRHGRDDTAAALAWAAQPYHVAAFAGGGAVPAATRTGVGPMGAAEQGLDGLRTIDYRLSVALLPRSTYFRGMDVPNFNFLRDGTGKFDIGSAIGFLLAVTAAVFVASKLPILKKAV